MENEEYIKQIENNVLNSNLKLNNHYQQGMKTNHYVL